VTSPGVRHSTLLPKVFGHPVAARSPSISRTGQLPLPPLRYAGSKELHVWDREFGFSARDADGPVSRMSLVSVTGFGKPG